MNFIDRVNRIESIDKKIRLRETGRPCELANDKKISESQLYETLKLMKKLGASIKFGKSFQSYYYTSRKKFFCGYLVDVIKYDY